MAARTGQVVARQRRNIQRICISGKNPQSPKSDGDKTCKTSADCGPNKCCLVNLSICMAYNLPGEMCLLGQVKQKKFIICYMLLLFLLVVVGGIDVGGIDVGGIDVGGGCVSVGVLFLVMLYIFHAIVFCSG